MKSMLTEYETEKWIRLEYRVLLEADGVCSRCRKRRAITAHHTTYEHGILCPPEFLMASARCVTVTFTARSTATRRRLS